MFQSVQNQQQTLTTTTTQLLYTVSEKIESKNNPFCSQQQPF